MIRNYLKTALRNILRNKLFSFLNILGLALGMATTVLILFWVKDELSYDKYNVNHDRIYRVIGDYYMNGMRFNIAASPPTLAAAVLNDYPEVQQVCRFRDAGSKNIRIGEKLFEEGQVLYADSSVFDVFTIPILVGAENNHLASPGTTVISEKFAAKYFDIENPVGKTVRVFNEAEDKYENFYITGVYKDIPQTSHFHTDIMLAMGSLEESKLQNWLYDNFPTYILLHPDADAKQLETKLEGMIVKYLGPDIERLMGKTLDEFMGDAEAAYLLQPLTDIHLKSDLQAEFEANSDITYVYFFSFIAFFILIIACINFMNMSTAKSEGRSREVGIRKVSGAMRRQVITQYILESLVITFLAHVLAMIIVELSLPWFNQLSGKEISIDYASPFTIVTLLTIIIVTGVVSGSYPAFYLSSFKPILVLKGGFLSGKGKGRLRNTLVTIQFVTTILLLAGSFIVYKQLHFIKNKDIGYNKDHVVLIHNCQLFGEKSSLFKDKLLSNPDIRKVSFSHFLPVPSSSNSSAVFPDGEMDKVVSVQQWSIEYDYLDAMQIHLTEGRNFSKSFSTDTAAMLINEATAKYFGWDNPMEHTITKFFGPNNTPLDFKIIGVVKDFNFKSMREKVKPLLMYLGKEGYHGIIRYDGTGTRDILSSIESAWNEFMPQQPFEYTFLADRFEKLYHREARIGQIVNIFTGLAIIIALLGLFGLATYIAEKRTKEIGIRKVNGASTYSIIILLSRDFSKLILIAFIIAVPIAWFVMNKWLEQFAFRIEMSWWLFVLAGLIAFTLALVTIIYQSYKTAIKNPVESLKYE